MATIVNTGDDPQATQGTLCRLLFAGMANTDVSANIETNGWDEVSVAVVAGAASSGTNPVRTIQHYAVDTLASLIQEDAGYHERATISDVAATLQTAGYQKSPLPKTLRIRIVDSGTLPVFSATTIAVYLRRKVSRGGRIG